MSAYCVTAHDDERNMVLQEIHLQNLICASVKGMSKNIFVYCGKRSISVNSESSPEVFGLQITDY